MRKKIILAAKHSVIEPLGLLHLAGLAKEEGWDPRIVLVPDHDFSVLDKAVKDIKPSVLGVNIYTGNHLQTFSYLDKLKNEKRDLNIVLGGPHATYFPRESQKHADYVVLSEGFYGLRSILQGDADRGIVELKKKERFPRALRRKFYRDYHLHDKSPIKSVITSSGCPYSCTYCYNSSTLDNIASQLKKKQIWNMQNVLGKSKKLFPIAIREVEDVIDEVKEILNISPNTRLIYFQDDLFGADMDWIREFAEKFPAIGIPFHAQMRFEYANPKNPKCRERINLIKAAGCTGLTFAIESSNPIIRKEILNRNMNDELIFEVLTYLNQLGLKVRTEQMLGLPYGATTQETPVNIEADLETLNLNVRLKKETGLPTMAWASIFAPYRGTPIGDYCIEHSFYSGGDNDVPDTFFQRSVLRFPSKWIGPGLKHNTNGYWLTASELEKYRDKLQMLRDLFNYFAYIPQGDKLARKFLGTKEKSFFDLSTETRRHLYDEVLYEVA